MINYLVVRMLSVLSNFIFGNSSLFGPRQSNSSSTWKDKRLAFDLRALNLRLDDGEQLIARFFPIEDVKGNPDEIGVLEVTNLRLIWICCSKNRLNLSIGWRSVSLTFVQNLKNSLGSPISSLVVLTRYESTKYEFVFNKMTLYADLWLSSDFLSDIARTHGIYGPNGIPRRINLVTPIHMIDSFDVVFKVWQAYKRTQLFRCSRANLSNLLVNSEQSTFEKEASMHSGLGRAGEFVKLPSEDTIDTYAGVVQSETRALKYTGTLILTNIRIIWIDEVLPPRNLSIPYIQIESVKLKQSDRLLISTYDYLATSNHVELSFPKKNESEQKRMRSIFEQIQNLCALYKAKPRFGPESCDECIQIASWLRPISDLQTSSEFREAILKGEEGIADPLGLLVDDTTVIRANMIDEMNELITTNSQRKSENDHSELENREIELDRVVSSKIGNYATDNRAVGINLSLIYCQGKCSIDELSKIQVVSYKLALSLTSNKRDRSCDRETNGRS